jgi:hypothetical protein
MMHDTIAPVLPLHPRATRTRKPNRRKDSIPSKVTYLRPRQLAGLSESAVAYGESFVAGNPELAAEIAEAIRLSLLQELASS